MEGRSRAGSRGPDPVDPVDLLDPVDPRMSSKSCKNRVCFFDQNVALGLRRDVFVDFFRDASHETIGLGLPVIVGQGPIRNAFKTDRFA